MPNSSEQKKVIVSTQASAARKAITLSAAAVPVESLRKYSSSKPLHRSRKK